MAVRIRLSRTGKKNAPSFRIVAIDSKRPRDGKALEILGHFDPNLNPPKFECKKDRFSYWQSQGAKITTAVEKLLSRSYKFTPYKPETNVKAAEEAKAG